MDERVVASCQGAPLTVIADAEIGGDLGVTVGGLDK
jgi:hypothetical protein